MAKHKKEIEVEYPDCDICGRDIGDGEYILLKLSVRMEFDRGFTRWSTEGSDVTICQSCMKNPLWKLELIRKAEEVTNKIKWKATRV